MRLIFPGPNRIRAKQTAAIIKGKSLEDSLRIGQLNAESVIKYIGAKNRLLNWREAENLLKHGNINITEGAI